ncbi:MAG: signal peptidase I, partial [Actinomycetia bacterium]|nr:signal peptidase I [Actinomycetes bacterium]
VDPARAENLKVGDIITFLPYPDDPTLVTHRIIGVGVGPDGARSFVTQGDANPDPDPWGPVPAAHVRGELWYVIPKIGYLRQSAGTHSVALVSGAAAVLIGAGAVLLLSSLRRRTSAPARRAEEA